jgi:hypothetical protein
VRNRSIRNKNTLPAAYTGRFKPTVVYFHE